MSSNISFQDLELELVQVIFRHGDRTPDKAEIYPNDPDKSFDYRPFGHGQLTNEGKKRAFKLGQILKSQYGSFLGEYKPENVYAYSTYYDRCKTSLQLVLAGLFPPSPEQTWNENLPWTPIPFEYNPPEKEIIYEALRNPNYPHLIKQSYQSSELKQKTEKYGTILDNLCKITGMPKKFESLSDIFLNIKAKKELGLSIPDWCDEKLIEDLHKAHQIRLQAFSHGPELRKLGIGKFLEKMVENINENINKTNSKRIYLYSAHDLTVYSILRAHNIHDIEEINYCSTVVLEKLRGKSDGKQYFRLLFWPGEGDNFRTLKLKNCDEICPFKEYLEIIDPVLPKKEDKLFNVNTREKVTWHIPDRFSTE